MATVARWVVEAVAVVAFGADDRLDLAGFTEAELEDGLAGARLRNICFRACLRCLTSGASRNNGLLYKSSI